MGVVGKTVGIPFWSFRFRRSRHKESAGNGGSSKRVVILGAGRVAAPLVDYLHRDDNVAISIACEMKDLADDIARKYSGVESFYLNALENPEALQKMLDGAAVAVSILPNHMHHIVAKACIKSGTHMVTASYVKDEVQQLHDEAQAAGVTILNELGEISSFRFRGFEMECFRSRSGHRPPSSPRVHTTSESVRGKGDLLRILLRGPSGARIQRQPVALQVLVGPTQRPVEHHRRRQIFVQRAGG